jgi:hypothetical protein
LRTLGWTEAQISSMELSARGAGALPAGENLAAAFAALGLAQRGLRGALPAPTFRHSRPRRGEIF